jgi:hypothetical protein
VTGAQREFLNAVAAELDPDAVPGRIVTAVIQTWMDCLDSDVALAVEWCHRQAGPKPYCAAVDDETEDAV